jgi:predicted ferric reductase
MRKYRSALIVGLFISITPILWFLSKLEFGWPETILGISQISALLAVTFLSLNYMISTRAKWIEKLFDGLDIAYVAHHNIGGMALLFMLTHPILLILKAIPNLELVKLYLLPSALPSYSVGIIGLYLYIILLLITYTTKIPYHLWVITHRFMGIPLLFISAHVALISSDVSRYLPLRIWILSILTFSISSYFYKRFLYPHLAQKARYVITRKNIKEGLVEIFLKPKGKKLSIYPGQFVFAKFKSAKVVSEEHPFSISSTGESDEIRLAIKRAGDYTSRVSDLSIGEEAVLIGPHGKFGENLMEDINKDMIWIAGGIGITPFISMLNHEIKKNGKRKITLVYSLSDLNGGNYVEELKRMVRGVSNVSLVVYDTSKCGRLNVEKLLGENELKGYNLKKTKFFMCGPKGMMKSLTGDLVMNAVAPWNIITEDFNLRS